MKGLRGWEQEVLQVVLQPLGGRGKHRLGPIHLVHLVHTDDRQIWYMRR